MSTRGLLRILVFVGSIGLIPKGIYLLPNVKDNILGAVAGRQLDPVNWILTSRVAPSSRTASDRCQGFFPHGTLLSQALIPSEGIQ